MTNLTKYEQETIINYNQGEELASCYTHDPALIRKLDKYAEKSTVITLVKSADGMREYSFPRKWVTIRFPREISDERRAEMAERMRQIAKERNTNVEA